MKKYKCQKRARTFVIIAQNVWAFLCTKTQQKRRRLCAQARLAPWRNPRRKTGKKYGRCLLFGLIRNSASERGFRTAKNLTRGEYA
ncbi:MAG: hypothetical protein KBS59_03725 [Clostridiales bacterium]|nr:hypothetical protein [Clostridiales bacterium]